MLMFQMTYKWVHVHILFPLGYHFGGHRYVFLRLLLLLSSRLSEASNLQFATTRYEHGLYTLLHRLLNISPLERLLI